MAKTPKGGIEAGTPATLASVPAVHALSPTETPTRKLPSAKPPRPVGRYSFIAPPMPDGSTGDATEEAALASTIPPPLLPGDADVA